MPVPTLPDATGHFGKFGGMFVPETLMAPLQELSEAYEAARKDPEFQRELDDLLTLLLKADLDKELTSQRERVRKYLKEVARLIRLQRGIRARTEGGDELPELSEDQQRIASETGKLGGEKGELFGRFRFVEVLDGFQFFGHARRLRIRSRFYCMIP